MSASVCVCVSVGEVYRYLCVSVFGLATTYICKLEFLTVIHVGYSDFTLGYVIVVVNVIGEEAHVYIHIVGREVFLWFSKKNRTYALSLGYHIFNAHVLYALCCVCVFGVFFWCVCISSIWAISLCILSQPGAGFHLSQWHSNTTRCQARSRNKINCIDSAFGQPRYSFLLPAVGFWDYLVAFVYGTSGILDCGARLRGK